MGSTHGHRHAQGRGKHGDSRAFDIAWFSDICTAAIAELYAVCLAKALVQKKLFAYNRTAVAKDSEMCRKMARVSLSSTPKDQKEESNGSVSHGKCAFAL